MGTMSLADLGTMVRELTFEGTGDNGLFASDARLNAVIQVAHQELWSKVERQQPTLIAATSSDCSITSSGYAYTNIDATNSVQIILSVEKKLEDGTYVPMEPMDRLEVSEVSSSSYQSSVNRWYAFGETVYLFPAPSGTETIRFLYVPNCPTLSGTTVYPFNNRLRNFHYMVAYRAAILALEKDEKAEVLRKAYKEMMDEFEQHIRRRQTFTPRKIRQVPHEDW